MSVTVDGLGMPSDRVFILQSMNSYTEWSHHPRKMVGDITENLIAESPPNTFLDVCGANVIVFGNFTLVFSNSEVRDEFFTATPVEMKYPLE